MLAAFLTMIVFLVAAPHSAVANNKSGSCSASGFALNTTVYYETAGANNLLWRVTKLTWQITGDSSRNENNAAFVFHDNTGWKASYENGSTTSNGSWYHYDVNWLMNKTSARFQIHGIFDVKLTEDPQCFGGFFYL